MRTSLSRILTRFIFCSAAIAGLAYAATIPQSSCSFNNVGGSGVNGGFTCHLYPSDASGNLNDINNGIQYPSGFNPGIDPITPGYLVIVDPGLDPTNPLVQANQADYLQVVEFAPVPGVPPTFSSTSINLYTLGCNNPANPMDTSCFPSYAAITATSHYFDVEPTSTPAYSQPYDYALGDVKMHEYFIYYSPEPAPSTVPEPCSLALFASGVGLLGLAPFRRAAVLRKRLKSK